MPACRVGYFGASTGAAAALWAAAEPDVDVAAVVSRGGRPDLAAPRLGAVTAPTLLIVGGHDDVALDLNRHAQPSCAARTASPSSLAPPTCSRNPAPSCRRRAARDWFVSHVAPSPHH